MAHKRRLTLIKPNVRVGSKTEVSGRMRHVRFTPNDQTSLREGVRSEKCQKGFRRDLREATPLAKILIVSDINMPGMSGLELLPKAKAARPDVPVIMITAYADDNTKRKALEGGADALTLLFDRRAYGTENLSPMPQKDFCNTICHKQTSE